MMTTTIQQTAKRYKLHMLLSALVLCIGTVTIIISNNATGQMWGASIAAIGLVWFLGARFLAWWNHG